MVINITSPIRKLHRFEGNLKEKHNIVCRPFRSVNDYKNKFSAPRKNNKSIGTFKSGNEIVFFLEVFMVMYLC